MFKGVTMELGNALTSIYLPKTEVRRHLVEFLKDTIIRVAIKGGLEQFLNLGCTLELPEEIKKYLCQLHPR